MSLWLRKLLRIPGPRALGWSDMDALGSSDLTPFQEGPTWEDWENYIKKNFPIRYFLAFSVPEFLAPISWKIGRIWYWLKCHILPSHRFHKLDFRGVDPLSNYTHGYMDPCHLMEIAAWAALRMYVEKEKPVDPSSWMSPEELAQECMKEQKIRYDEAMELYNWWMRGRVDEEARENALYKTFETARKTRDKESYESKRDEWLAYCKWREEHSEEQFLRLAKLRPYLWS